MSARFPTKGKNPHHGYKTASSKARVESDFREDVVQGGRPQEARSREGSGQDFPRVEKARRQARAREDPVQKACSGTEEAGREACFETGLQARAGAEEAGREARSEAGPQARAGAEEAGCETRSEACPQTRSGAEEAGREARSEACPQTRA